ncbi:ATPase [Rhizobium lusitanum]|uniref:Xylose transport system permease protein XylH n=1 Tax=Rhizobium lusitanum TaxID=293958 RepID=A0A6L9UL78_9HYPH|nr:ATPase [Rhizobium lusitanum]NEI74600.1 ATPase [Rhizobium lusitanum]
MKSNVANLKNDAVAVASSDAKTETPNRANSIISILRSAAGLLAAIAIVWLVFSLLTDGIFVSDRNLSNLMRQTAITAIVALGMLVVIAQGEIDLSVGSFMSLCVTVVAMIEASGTVGPWVTIFAALAMGVAVGLWNSAWVAKLGLPSFVATLGSLMLLRGLALALSGGRTISGISDGIRFFGDAFVTGPALWAFIAVAAIIALWPLRSLSQNSNPRSVLIRVALGFASVVLLAWATLSYRGLPMPVAITLTAAGLLAWMLTNTVWGRHVYAVGGNRAAAKSAGIPITKHLVTSFILIGVLTAIGTLMFVGRLGSAPPESGLFLELNAIAAVVIGGASLYGGTGRVSGVLLGALLMQSLGNGLSLLNVPTAYQNITSGIVLMLAVYIDVLSKRGGKLFARP